MISRFLLLLLAGAVLFAQDPRTNAQPPDLRVFLNLPGSQIQGLIQLQQQKGKALQPVAQQATQTQQKASNVLQSDQKTKLPPLQLTLELQPAALQAVSLGLLNAP